MLSSFPEVLVEKVSEENQVHNFFLFDSFSQIDFRLV